MQNSIEMIRCVSRLAILSFLGGALLFLLQKPKPVLAFARCCYECVNDFGDISNCSSLPTDNPPNLRAVCTNCFLTCRDCTNCDPNDTPNCPPQ